MKARSMSDSNVAIKLTIAILLGQDWPPTVPYTPENQAMQPGSARRSRRCLRAPSWTFRGTGLQTAMKSRDRAAGPVAASCMVTVNKSLNAKFSFRRQHCRSWPAGASGIGVSELVRWTLSRRRWDYDTCS